jgi:hypothetical protein
MQFRSLYLTTNRANYCCNRHFAAFQAFPVTQPLTSAILSSEIRISCPAVTSSLQATFQLYRPETFKMCNVGGRSGSKYFYYKALVDFTATEYSVVITSHSACSERLRRLSRSPRLRLKKNSQFRRLRLSSCLRALDSLDLKARLDPTLVTLHRSRRKLRIW